MAEKTDIVVPEKVIPAGYGRTPVELKICGKDSLFPMVPFGPETTMKASVGANEGVLLPVPFIYKLKYGPGTGKRIAVWMTIRVEEEEGEEPVPPNNP